MTGQPSTDMKVCPYCGQMTSTKANFCYYCARELVARPEHPDEKPEPFHVNWVVVGVVMAVILALAVLFVFR